DWIKIRTYSTQRIKEWEKQTKATVLTTFDTISPSRYNLLANTLGHDAHDQMPPSGTVIPPCWHHVYFPPRTQEHDLAHDGYETEFFPPPPFSQRMWVGARMTWNPSNPLKIDDQVKMVTQLDHAQVREGRLGESVMVWINKDIENQKGWSMQEQRCLVYHPPQEEANTTRVRKSPGFYRTMTPSSILLFRYSALTFNSHKIHFDHLYATQVEKHPACLVHGPLSGTLLMHLLGTQTNRPLSTFEYKCLMPLYVHQPLTLAGRQSKDKTYELWITNSAGHLAVKGTATVA
ncbi:hypothetical protein CU098_000621, partial [Rhizopus stolonifer]